MQLLTTWDFALRSGSLSIILLVCKIRVTVVPAPWGFYEHWTRYTVNCFVPEPVTVGAESAVVVTLSQHLSSHVVFFPLLLWYLAYLWVHGQLSEVILAVISRPSSPGFHGGKSRSSPYSSFTTNTVEARGKAVTQRG